MNHELKCHPEYFKALNDGDKTCELRKNDRNFSRYDLLKLKEYFPKKEEYSGREIFFIVTDVLENYPGLEKGYCMLSLTRAYKVDWK